MDNMSSYDMDNLIRGMLSKTDIEIEKKSKTGVHPVNIRPLIYSLSAIKKDLNVFILEAFLSAGKDNNLRADLFTEAFMKETGLGLKILSLHRKALLASASNEWKDPFEVVNG
jgi:hypothetical protein